MAKYIFIGSLLFALVCQIITWTKLNQLDLALWADQAKYVVTFDPNQYNFGVGYGHPGSTIIDGTIMVQKLTQFSYFTSLVVFLCITSAVAISLIATLCYTLAPQSFWWLGTLIILSINRMYDYATPPSALVSLLLVLLLLITLYLINNKPNAHVLMLWGVISGLAVSTRTDIGILTTLALSLALARQVGIKKILLINLTALCVFILTDTYMWHMPIQHLKDLVYKMTFHYSDFTPSTIGIGPVLQISALALTSIFLSIALLFINKPFSYPLPKHLLIILGLLTIITSAIFLTSKYQAPRYFMPLIFIWELFLPFFLFQLTQQSKVRSGLLILFLFINQIYLAASDSFYFLHLKYP